MKIFTAQTLAIVAVAFLSGCLSSTSGRLEVLNPKQAYGKSIAVIGDFHRENAAIEERLASDLKAALSKRGLTVIEDPSKADLVVLPTLGRMRERSAAAIVSTDAAAGEPVQENTAALPASPPGGMSSPVIAAPEQDSRRYSRFSEGNLLVRTDLSTRRAVPSAHAPASAQQAGLLLTAYLAKDYSDYGIGRQSLPPVWRVYVSQPVVQLKWNAVAAPLVNAAASAAMPLARASNEEEKAKKEERRAEQPELRDKKKTEPMRSENGEVAAKKDAEPKKRKEPGSANREE